MIQCIQCDVIKDNSHFKPLSYVCNDCKNFLISPKYIFEKEKKEIPKITQRCYEYQNKKRLQTNKIAKISRLKIKFGLTLEDYESILDMQNYRCAICETHQKDLKKDLAVDHCHKTGKIRGLLCGNCNRAAGLLKDKVGNAERLVFYLIKHKD